MVSEVGVVVCCELPTAKKKIVLWLSEKLIMK